MIKEKESISFIREKLEKADLKVTHPRIVVFKAVMESHTHPTADQIYEGISDDNPSIAKGTVYRILDDLSEVGLVNQVATKQGNKRYDANLSRHAHIYCLQTHEIQDYYDEELNDLITDFFNKKSIKNFNIKDIKVQVNGEKVDPKKKVNIV